MSAPFHNRLAVLAADIVAAHRDVERGALAVAERALAAGRMLAEAKASLPHGEWATWLADNVGIPARTARRYMQLARSGVESATVAEIGIRGSSEKLARSRIPRPPEGHYAEAILLGKAAATIWRAPERPDRFHICVASHVDETDPILTATSHPVPDELLSIAVSEAGFPIGCARFCFKPIVDRYPAFLRDIVHGRWA
jgi:hypothetical protein